MLKIHLSIKKIPPFFLTMLSILTLMGVVKVLIQSVTEKLDRFLPIINPGSDSSLPTWYSSFSLFFCSILCVIILEKVQQINKKQFIYWGILSLIFCLMPIDEVARIHETFGEWLDENFATTREGLFYYSWVLIAIPLVSIFVLSYSKFIMQLPNITRRFFILGLATLIAGGLGVEMLSANHDSLNGRGNLIYNILVTVEEFLEMLGVYFFICALISYIRESFKGIHILVE